jgi:hypothetical protein
VLAVPYRSLLHGVLVSCIAIQRCASAPRFTSHWVRVHGEESWVTGLAEVV